MNSKMINNNIIFVQVFFPVSTSEHFFLLCINHMEEKIHIIDNRKLPQHISVQSKYEEQPKMMVSNYVHFCLAK